MKIEFNRLGVRLAYEKVQEFERFDLYQIYLYSNYKIIIKDGSCNVVEEQYVEGYIPMFKECYFHGQNPSSGSQYESLKSTREVNNYNPLWASHGSLRRQSEVSV
jgi:hypothetical protein